MTDTPIRIRAVIAINAELVLPAGAHPTPEMIQEAREHFLDYAPGFVAGQLSDHYSLPGDSFAFNFLAVDHDVTVWASIEDFLSDVAEGQVENSPEEHHG